MSLRNNIKEKRLEKNIPQAELADAIKCDKRTISRYETGLRSPSLEIALRLARYLELSMDELFELDDMN